MKIKSPKEWIELFNAAHNVNRPGYALVTTKDIEDIQINVCQYFHDKYGYAYDPINGHVIQEYRDNIQSNTYEKRKHAN